MSRSLRCGTVAGYRAHERAGQELCEDCLRARREYMRKYTDRRKRNRAAIAASAKARLADGRLAHGTSHAYDAAGCRCDQCRAWRREKRQREAQRKAGQLMERLAGAAEREDGTVPGGE